MGSALPRVCFTASLDRAGRCPGEVNCRGTESDGRGLLALENFVPDFPKVSVSVGATSRPGRPHRAGFRKGLGHCHSSDPSG